MLKNRKLIYINNFNIFIPSHDDELFSLIYHYLVQKHNNPKRKKHHKKILELGSDYNIYVDDQDDMFEILVEYMINNKYYFSKPKDIKVGFYVPNIYKSKIKNIIY